MVRKSTNGGASFSTVDDLPASGSYAEALRFAATSNGDLYVAGVLGGHGILRKSAGGTGAWTTVDDFPFYPHAMATDASGNLFVGGYGEDAFSRPTSLGAPASCRRVSLVCACRRGRRRSQVHGPEAEFWNRGGLP